jgi:nucleotide-binding universal stress UspA family protein
MVNAYRHMAVASTFSPTHRAVMAEAMNFARHVGAKLDVLHAASRTPEKEAAFAETFAALDGDTPEVIWLSDNGRPADTLLEAAAERGYDLLVAGALEREAHQEEKAFTGSVARRFLVEAPSDVLLVPRPNEKCSPPTGLFFAAEPGQDVSAFLKKSLRVLAMESMTFAVAESPFAAAIASSRGEQAPDAYQWAEEVCESLDQPSLDVEIRVIDSNTGFAVCDAAQCSNADLMVVRAKRSNGRIVFPSHLNWLQQVIPMRLLISVAEE